ncbi:MarR family transcriptional regulator [Kiritimatiellaeota bacterium B1221]|nr:MarR family transcriptional regulator [Kiritimatiellaeota bacterium B1221]
MHLEEKVFRQLNAKNPLFSELSSVQMKVAMYIHQSQPIGLTQLADHLGLSHPSASVIVEKLVEKEVVSRETDPADRRRIQLRIHAKSETRVNEIMNRFQSGFADIACKVGDENLERWYQVALKLNEILEIEKSPK